VLDICVCYLTWSRSGLLTNDIVIRYTSFTACSILLLSASQKLLMLCGEHSSQDLSYASSHLDVLSMCSYENNMTRKLYIPLRIIFNDIREVLVSPVYRNMCELDVKVADTAIGPFSHHVAVEGAVEISRSIVDVLRRIMGVLQESLDF
jgi:hypothetical protein